MIKKLPLSFLLCVLIGWVIPGISTAQPRCGFDAMHNRLLTQSPGYAKAVAAQDAAIQKVIEETITDPNLQERRVITGADTVYEIPLVLHVIHTGGAVGSPYNPSDAQLLGMITYLNQSYEATWPAYASVALGGTKVPLRFVLAQRTPTCGATSGIVRVNGSTLTNYTSGGVMQEDAVGGVTDSALKSLSIWPANQYYNIWIVNRIDGVDGNSPGTFIAGYATFPGGLSYMDGTVMLASQAAAGSKTLPHEIGHAFNLYHTFQGSSGPTGSVCPANTNCLTQGDRVCDTDPSNQDAFFTCPSGNNPCTGLPWNNQQTNFMHYTSCADQRFTPGQRDRIMASLLVARPGLNTSQALTPPPAVAMTAATCTPASITNVNNQFGMGPTRVTLNTLDDSSLSYSNTLKFYEDNTCNLGTTLVIGQAGYSISVSTALNQQIARAYIDYNDDGTFGAGEQVLNSTAPSAQPNYTHTASVLVPATAVQNKRLRLRVVADFASNTTLGPCSNPEYGQAEDYYIIAVPSTGLPIRIYAEAIAVEGNRVTFSFKAAEQDQVKNYRLQRADPDMNFKTIQEFPASANSSYTLNDQSLQQGTYYYRILATEYDGNQYFSRTLAAVTKTSGMVGALQLYPNPAKENFEVRLPVLPQGNIRAIVTDIYGKKIIDKSFSPQTTLTIHSNLVPGIYFLTVLADNNKWSQKLIIAR